MKKLIFPLLLLTVALTVIASPGGGDSNSPAPAQTSALWVQSGELWAPETSRLREFTSVGYMSGRGAPNLETSLNSPELHEAISTEKNVKKPQRFQGGRKCLFHISSSTLKKPDISKRCAEWDPIQKIHKKRV
jgi:hypothetical protein